MAARTERNPLTSAPAATMEAAVVGTELLCSNYEGITDRTIVGKITGVDGQWARLRIDEIDRDWLVRHDRIDLAKGTWQHVDADYPALGADAEFDALYRPMPKTKEDPKHAAAIKEAAAKLGALLPASLRKHVEDLAGGAVDRLTGGPDGSVLARWMGKGTLDAPFVERTTRKLKRGATNGTEGWFPKPSVKKYEQHFEML